MKSYTVLLALTLMFSSALYAAPSAEARALFANMKLDHFGAFVIQGESGLSEENEKTLKEEFSPEAYMAMMCEHFDKTYSEKELREMNELWKQPAMQRLTEEMVGEDSPLNKISGDWAMKYHRRIESLKEKTE